MQSARYPRPDGWSAEYQLLSSGRYRVVITFLPENKRLSHDYGRSQRLAWQFITDFMNADRVEFVRGPGGEPKADVSLHQERETIETKDNSAYYHGSNGCGG